VHHTCKSKQPFRKYSTWNIAPYSEGVHRNVCEKRRFRNFFFWLSSKYLDEQLCRWKLLIETILQQSFVTWCWKIGFSVFFHVLIPKWGGVKVGFCCHWKAHAWFPNVHWSYFDFSSDFLMNRSRSHVPKLFAYCLDNYFNSKFVFQYISTRCTAYTNCCHDEN